MACGHPVQYAIVEGLTLCFSVQVRSCRRLRVACSTPPAHLRLPLQLDAPSAAQLHAVFATHLPLAAREAGRRHAAVAADAVAAAAAVAELAPPVSQAAPAAPLAGAKRKKAAAAAASEEARAAAAAATVAGAGSGLSGVSAVDASSQCVVEGVIVPLGTLPPVDRADDGGAGRASYVLVPSIRRHLHSLARAVSTGGRYPVLLQGPTSSGKTSVIEYLAALTGHACARINNHEHTDIAEYLGTYVPDPLSGRLVFTDGLLVKALRT